MSIVRSKSKKLPTFAVGKSFTRSPASPVSYACCYLLGHEYRIQDILGEGAYGTVAAAIHEPTGTNVAIKKVLPFDHTLFCLRTLRELKLLKFFSRVNDNVSTTVLPLMCRLCNMFPSGR